MEPDEANIGNTFGNEPLLPMLPEPVWSPIICWSDVVIGDLIGSGTFASVYKVKLPNHSFLPPSNYFSFSRDSGPARNSDDLLLGENEDDVIETFVSSSRHSYNSVRDVGVSTKTYALKRLSAIVLNSPSNVQLGVRGMIFEAKVLSQVLRSHHPNIVQMHGMSPNFLMDPKQGFIILEYLNDTLDIRLLRMKDRQSMLSDHSTKEGRFQRIFDLNSKQEKKHTIQYEQFKRTKFYGLGIASALAHLHRHRILYRDLKPANIGFDEHGMIKLFDFDLSRILDEDDVNNRRRLTAGVGSLRYMSPECSMGKPYGFPSDVHSFAILLWEICTLQRPYNNVHTTSVLVKRAFLGLERPSLRLVTSTPVKSLLQKSWNPNPEQRPCFRSIVNTLRSLEFSNDTKKRRASLSGRNLKGSAT
jgi:serine/threonine protein kinase